MPCNDDIDLLGGSEEDSTNSLKDWRKLLLVTEWKPYSDKSKTSGLKKMIRKFITRVLLLGDLPRAAVARAQIPTEVGDGLLVRQALLGLYLSL